MKYALFTIAILLTNLFSVAAQSEQKIRVHAGEDLSAAISGYGEYRFPAFTKGTLLYKYSKSSTALFNYSLVLDEMRFITPGGDTLAIANPDQVSFINIGNTFYYYNNNGYQEVVADYDSVKLAVQKKITIDYEKIGAYGQPNTSSAIDNNQTYSDNSGFYKLTINKDAVVSKTSKWFLIDARRQSMPATKANFLKLFDAQSKNINAYIKANDIKFSSEDDLKKLLQFCMQQQ